MTWSKTVYLMLVAAWAVYILHQQWTAVAVHTFSFVSEPTSLTFMGYKHTHTDDLQAKDVHTQSTTTFFDSLAQLARITTNGDDRDKLNLACPQLHEHVDYIRINDTVPSNPLRNANINCKIPPIIHQTAKSRCVTPTIYKNIQQWQNFANKHGYYYFFHTDDAIMRLLQREYANYPNLQLVLESCVRTPNPNSGTLLADLWRYLVLYKFGGIYADLDTIPTQQFDPSLYCHSDSNNTIIDALFVVEQYHILSQYFMAIAPGHPLAQLAFTNALDKLMNPYANERALPMDQINAALYTGPHALHQAMQQFADAGIPNIASGNKPIKAGLYRSELYNWTVTAIGDAGNQDEYIVRSSIKARNKKNAYKLMDMHYFMDTMTASPDHAIPSCPEAIARKQQESFV